MRFGYARVSTPDQTGSEQLSALREAGCSPEHTVFEVASGVAARPELRKLLDYMRRGDVLVVTSWDRLARSLRELLDIGHRLETTGIELASLREGWDTTTPSGRLLFSVLGAMAEMEREVLRERGRHGAAVARRIGKQGGRAPALTGAEVALLLQEKADGRLSTQELAERYGVSRRTIRRYCAAAPKPPPRPTPIEERLANADKG